MAPRALATHVRAPTAKTVQARARRGAGRVGAQGGGATAVTRPLNQLRPYRTGIRKLHPGTTVSVSAQPHARTLSSSSSTDDAHAILRVRPQMRRASCAERYSRGGSVVRADNCKQSARAGRESRAGKARRGARAVQAARARGIHAHAAKHTHPGQAGHGQLVCRRRAQNHRHAGPQVLPAISQRHAASQL